MREGAVIATRFSNYGFRAIGIIAALKNGEAPEKAVQTANEAGIHTTWLNERRREELDLDGAERIRVCCGMALSPRQHKVLSIWTALPCGEWVFRTSQKWSRDRIDRQSKEGDDPPSVANAEKLRFRHPLNDQLREP
jgi:hypothetical protein